MACASMLIDFLSGRFGLKALLALVRLRADSGQLRPPRH